MGCAFFKIDIFRRSILERVIEKRSQKGINPLNVMYDFYDYSSRFLST